MSVHTDTQLGMQALERMIDLPVLISFDLSSTLQIEELYSVPKVANPGTHSRTKNMNNS